MQICFERNISMKEVQTVQVMGTDFVNETKEDFLENFVFPNLINEKKCFIVTANPEIVMRAREDSNYQQILQSADYVVPDGAGILMAAKYKKQPIKERIAGTDLMMDLFQFGNENKLSCYLLGATEDVIERVVKEVERQFPNVTIAGYHHGFFDLKDQAIVEAVKQSSPDLVFVATGFPRQEQWIYDNLNQFDKGVFMGLGGSFDVLAGEVKRAPESWIKLNLEWLYRLIQQPVRFKRVTKIFSFMIRVLLRRE